MSRTGRDGLLLVDKPAGVSSHDVVLAARRAIGERRIGHAGTLDPFATGLLVLLIGRATRLLPYVAGDPKVYVATMRFGAETTTDDPLGTVVRTAAAPTPDAVREALPQLTGEIDQRPPDYSAKRIRGRRAYQAAREGDALTLAPVRVRVDGWRLGPWDGGDVEVTVTCGGGTYVRALARDLGRLVGSAAHLAALRRTRSGPFDVRDAVSLTTLAGGSDVALRPAADALGPVPTQRLTADDVARVVRGVPVRAAIAGDRGALLHGDTGVLVAFAERRGDVWQPRVVMREPA